MDITVWFEFASPYSYLAVERLTGPAAPADITVRWKPVLLGPLFKDHGWDTSPFLIYPAKGRYMWRDMERLCAEAGLAFRRPEIFPQHTVLAARVACLGEGEDWLPAYVRAVYRANFADGADISDPAVLAGLLDGLGLEGAALVDRAPSARDGLRANVEEARALGVFGAPTIMVGEEMFWGADRLDQALAWALARAPGGARATASEAV